MPLSPQEIAQYAYRAGFRGADLVKAVAIAIAESGGNPQAYNPELAAGTKKGGGSRGLWQIYGTAHPEFNNSTVFDPQANADAAYKVYREAGNKFTPWTTWTKGIASQIIPTLPKFSIDTSPAAISQATTKAVGQMTGTVTQAASDVASAPGEAISQGIKSGVDGAIQSIKRAVLGEALGQPREGLDAGVYVGGLILLVMGIAFLFLQTDTGKATAALAGEGVKVAATGGLAKAL